MPPFVFPTVIPPLRATAFAWGDNGLDDLLKAAYAVHGCSSDVFELTLWAFTRKNVELQPFCWGGGILFRTVVRAGGNLGKTRAVGVGRILVSDISPQGKPNR